MGMTMVRYAVDGESGVSPGEKKYNIDRNTHWLKEIAGGVKKKN